MIQKFLQKQMPVRLWAVLFCLLVALRMFVACNQRVFLMPEASPLDDMLMVRAAVHIGEGNWLGPYGGLAMAKNMGFALWLALVHFLKIPILVANAGLWVFASAFAARALRPLFTGNLSRLLLFAFFAFAPFSYDNYTLRVYRDAIFPAFCLLLFAGILGLALRLKQPGARGAALCGLGAGLGLGGGVLIREDGAVLLIFALCALGAMLLWLLLRGGGRNKPALPFRWKKTACLALPLLVTGLFAASYAGANYAYYGVFLMNDLNQGAFPGAYGALAAVSGAESGFTPRRPVSRATLEKGFEELPTLALLEETLTEGSAMSGFGNAETGEYYGSFYYALKLAAQYAEVAQNAGETQDYFAQMEAEIDKAVAEGRLQSQGPVAGVIPPLGPSLNAKGPEIAALTGESLLYLLTFKDFIPWTQESLGPDEKVDEVAAYVHSKVQRGYVEGTDQPYYNPLQKITFALCDALVWVYRVAVWPLLAYGLYGMGKALVSGLRGSLRAKKPTFTLLLGLLSLGLLLSVLLRLFVFAFMDVMVFDIGIYMMYLAGAGPPLLTFCVFAPHLAAVAARAQSAPPAPEAP